MATETISEEQATATITVDRHNAEGEVIDAVELDPTIFGVAPNVPLMHQVVTAQLAARRSGTHSTKTRSEVAGGGAKPYRQKGTGRARQGSTRAPQFAGGGVAFGPKPRSYAQRTPRKMVRLALCSALSDRVAEGKLRIVDSWPFEIPKTKDAVKALDALSVGGRTLVVLSSDDAVAERSFGNLPRVTLVEAAQLTAYEVMANDWIIFTSDTVPGGVTVVEGSAEAATAAREAAADVAAEAAAEVAAAEEAAAVEEAADAAAAPVGGETSADSEDSVADDTSPAVATADDADAESLTDEAEGDADEDDEADDDDAEGEVSSPDASSVAASTDDEEDEDENEEEGE